MDSLGKLVNVLSFEREILVLLTNMLLTFYSEPPSFFPSTVFVFALFWFPCAPEIPLEVSLTLFLESLTLSFSRSHLNLFSLPSLLAVDSSDSDQEDDSMMTWRELQARYHERRILTQDYNILCTLDSGSFAQVKLALHVMTQTLVAIKVLERGTNTDFEIISEIDLMKSFYHRNIIQLLQIVDTRYTTYIVMEYASRGSLQEHINKYGRLDEKEARSIIRELCLAVDYMHSQNIAHRDIKAKNILLDSEGHVKLTDFGLSIRLAAGEKLKGFCGTPRYCAPELFGHMEYEVLPTDIWSIGVVLYYLVIGQLPFRARMTCRLKYEILSWSGWIPYQLSPDLEDLLKRLMTMDPTMRPPIKEILAHPWLHHDQNALRALERFPICPEPSIVFDMYLMGCNVQELRIAFRERNYNRSMATYLIINKKTTWKPQTYLRATDNHNHSWPVRKISSAPSLPKLTLLNPLELPGHGRKGYSRRYIVPPSLSSFKYSFKKKTSLQQRLMPHVGNEIFIEKEVNGNKIVSEEELNGNEIVSEEEDIVNEILKEEEDIGNEILKEEEDIENEILREEEDMSNEILTEEEDMSNEILRLKEDLVKEILRLKYEILNERYSTVEMKNEICRLKQEIRNEKIIVKNIRNMIFREKSDMTNEILRLKEANRIEILKLDEDIRNKILRLNGDTTYSITSSSKGNTSTTVTRTMLTTHTSISEDMLNAFISSSDSTDTSRTGSSSWDYTTSVPFPSVEIQNERTDDSGLQDSSSSLASEPDPQEQPERHHQPVPRVSTRRWSWKGLKKRISKTLRRLCCCLPAANDEVVTANEGCFQDTG